MTAQIKNTFLYKDIEFNVCGDKVEVKNKPDPVSDNFTDIVVPINDNQVIFVNHSEDNQVNFHPEQVGLTLNERAISSSCWQGFHFDYAICEQRLTVKNLYVFSEDAGSTSKGITPVKTRYSDTYCYEEINHSVIYSGSILLGANCIHGRYSPGMGFRFSWMYEKVIELVFENGLFVREIDHSSLMHPIRQQMEEDARKMAERHQQEADEKAWLKTREPETTDTYYDYFIENIETTPYEDWPIWFRPHWPLNQFHHERYLGYATSYVKEVIIRRIKIERFVQEREIPHLLHFTKLSNLQGILKHGIYPHSQLEELPFDVEINDEERWDNRPETVSLSIGHPNSLMFYKYRQSTHDDWVVIQIDPNILWQWKCAFCKHNAADRRISRARLRDLMKVGALIEMYSEIEGLPSRDKSRLLPFDPTDPQAEVLAFDVIPPNKILGVVFRDETLRNEYEQKYPGLNTSYRREGASVFSDRSSIRRD